MTDYVDTGQSEVPRMLVGLRRRFSRAGSGRRNAVARGAPVRTTTAAVSPAEELREARARLEVLESLALRDPLTGLMNRRAFCEQSEAALGQAERHGHPVALMVVDLDGFKAVNDLHGHPTGDEVLRAVAARLRGGVRPGDVCGRTGGDEFMLCLADASTRRAEEIAGRLGAAVAAIEFGPGHASLSLSAGIAVFPRHGRELPALNANADAALYRAKVGGGNRVCVAAEEKERQGSSNGSDHVERHRLNVQNAVTALARAIDARNGYTHLHSHAVAALAATIAAAIGMEGARIEQVRRAGVLHDVGKIGVPDAILWKDGPLGPEELEVMRTHSSIGAHILVGSGLPEVAHWVGHLHERYDGGGYPDGLSGDAIPLESRVLHVADALDAMTSPRVYRTPLSADAALADLRREAGRQFDPHLVAVVLDLARKGELALGRGDGGFGLPAGVGRVGAQAVGGRSR